MKGWSMVHKRVFETQVVKYMGIAGSINGSRLIGDPPERWEQEICITRMPY